MIVNPMNISDIVKEYHNGTVSPLHSVHMIQYLLDTDQLLNYPELYELADRYVLEGLCYYVPSEVV